ncbi:MAG: hypothetical protein ACREAB_16305 [Blastocatellia bacterium]
MRTQRNLPKIQNGPLAKRQARSKNPATSKAFGAFGSSRSSSRPRSNRGSTRVLDRAPNRRDGRDGEGRGTRVMWMMILIGVALAAGFVFALRSQVNAYKLGQAEEQLRGKLDEYTGQQKFLMLDQQRALNTSESDRAGRQNGLDQLKLDQPSVLHGASIQKIVHQVPSTTRSPQVGQSNRPNGNGQSILRSIKQPAKPNSYTKAIKAEKIVKSNASKANMASNSVKANAAKAKKRNNNQRQTAQSQKRR